MSNLIKIKRSAVEAKSPLTTDIELGELAINTFDGKLFLKKNDGIESIISVATGGGTVTGTNTGTNTGDQSDAEIKISYENNPDTNVFDNDHLAKLDNMSASANQYIHPTYSGDDYVIDLPSLSGANVIGDLYVDLVTDTIGHVISASATTSTRVLTLDDLGYTAASATESGYVTTGIQTLSGAKTLTDNLTVEGTLYATGDVTAPNFIGDITGTVTGNADSSTAWATGRTITLSGDVSGTSPAWDGSGNLLFINTVVADDSHNHITGNVDGLDIALSGKVTSVSGTSPISSTTGTTPVISMTAANGTTSGYVTGVTQSFAGQKTFSTGITGTLTGNASTATKLATTRAIQITGDVTGTANFDGSDAINIITTITDNSHAHIIGNVDGLQTALDGKIDDGQVLTNVPLGALFTDTVYDHPAYLGDDFSIDTGPLTGVNVISDLAINVTTDLEGHVVDTNAAVSTRAITFADFGYTGESDATADQTALEIKTLYETNASTNAFDDGLLSKLNGVETLADVTDSVNVDTAGAVMNTDTTTVEMSFVIDEDTFITNSSTLIPTQQSVKAYVDSTVAGAVSYKSGYDAATNTPDLDVSPTGITIGDMYTVTVSGQFFSTDVPVGTWLIADISDPILESDWAIVSFDIQPDTYIHPTHPGDDSSIDTGVLSGVTVVSDISMNITTDTLGHVTDTNAAVSTRSLTFADFGYTGEIDATADQTALEIKTLYESNLDTNNLTDTLLGNILTNNDKVSNISTSLSLGTITSTNVPITSDGTGITTLPAATSTLAGIVTNGVQSFGGMKTFSTGITGTLTGNASTATTAGTVTTADQPTITSVGTLSSLSVTGTIGSSNFSGSSSGTNTGDNAGVTSIATSGSITGGTITSSGTISHLTTDGNKHVPANSTTNSGKVLTSSAVAGTYTWEDAASGSGTVTSVTGNLPISVATGTTTPVISIADASGSVSGVVNITTQSFAGAKTFTDTITSTKFVGTDTAGTPKFEIVWNETELTIDFNIL